MKTWSVRHTFTCQFGIETLMSHYLYRFISSSEMRTRLWGSQTNFNSSKVQFELTRVFEDFFPVDVSIPVRCNLSKNYIIMRKIDFSFNSSKVQFEHIVLQASCRMGEVSIPVRCNLSFQALQILYSGKKFQFQ